MMRIMLGRFTDSAWTTGGQKMMQSMILTSNRNIDAALFAKLRANAVREPVCVFGNCVVCFTGILFWVRRHPLLNRRICNLLFVELF